MSFDLAVFRSTLHKALDEWDLDYSKEKLLKMDQFAQLVVEANKTLNLTRIVESQEMAIKNFLDSLSCCLLDWPDHLKCLDLGTGAGFPGIPLALCYPGWSVMLLDSLQKRLTFLKQAANQLGLANVATFHARAEDAGRDKNHREAYDLVVSRAVANLPVLLELSTPLVKVGGHFVAFKASEAANELSKSSFAQKKLNVELEQMFPLQLPLSMGERNLLVFRKVKSTPKDYPRRPGIPNKQPL